MPKLRKLSWLTECDSVGLLRREWHSKEASACVGGKIYSRRECGTGNNPTDARANNFNSLMVPRHPWIFFHSFLEAQTCCRCLNLVDNAKEWLHTVTERTARRWDEIWSGWFVTESWNVGFNAHFTESVWLWESASPVQLCCNSKNNLITHEETFARARYLITLQTDWVIRSFPLNGK